MLPRTITLLLVMSVCASSMPLAAYGKKTSNPSIVQDRELVLSRVTEHVRAGKKTLHLQGNYRKANRTINLSVTTLRDTHKRSAKHTIVRFFF